MTDSAHLELHNYQSMTVNEYAAFEQATTNEQLLNKDGFWWRRVRHGFYRPLTPFLPELTPSSKPHGSLVQYGLYDTAHANSFLNLIVFDTNNQYHSNNLSQSMRRHLKIAVNQGLNVKQISNPRILMDQAYNVYRSFVYRTGYEYDNKRIVADFFQKWILSLQRFPKSKLHGVFYKKYLLSFQISVLVEDVLVLKTLINSKMGLQLHSSDLQLHYYRKIACKQENIRMIYDGYFSQRYGLNLYKLIRGAKVWYLPARIDAPFPLLMMARIIRPLDYKYLMGFTEYELSHEYKC
ncbi:hypothetical protein HQ585_13850 [candidate division KSB1 bacterium]|nr:hypothetical protein [candidate division KSB1 bacterium]